MAAPLETAGYSAVSIFLAGLVAALDPVPFRQGGDGAWREAEQPLIPGFAPGSLAHLAFTVTRGESRNANTRRGVDRLGMTTEYLIRWSYRLRPTEQVADARQADDAAEQMIRAVRRQDDGLPGAIQALRVIRLPAPVHDLESQYLILTLILEVDHDLHLTL